ncbi:MAG: DUF2892 domain-containing protein [Gemmatimonadota bacterium]
MDRLLPKNEGTADRVIRAALGLAILSLTVVGPQTMWGLLGLIFIGTAVVGSCPIYTMLGMNTCGVPKPK